MRGWWWLLGGVACAGGTDGLDDSGVVPTDNPFEPLLQGLRGVWRGPALTIDLAATDDGRLFGRTGQPPDDFVRLLVTLTDDGGSEYRYDNSAGRSLVGYPGETDGISTVEWVGANGDGESATVLLEIEDGELSLTTTENGQRGFSFEAQRLRDVPPGTFVEHPAEAPDPVLPTLTIPATWTAESTTHDLIVTASREPCQTGCVPSRVASVRAQGGIGEATVVIPELHPGDWYVSAFLDRNGNASPSTSFQPDSADRFALPDQTVTVTGDTSLPLTLDRTL